MTSEMMMPWYPLVNGFVSPFFGEYVMFGPKIFGPYGPNTYGPY
jgi:hypothetical protein